MIGMSPSREPMPSEQSCTDGMDGADLTVAGAASGTITAGSSSVMDFRNVRDGTKNRFPVAARLKSSSRS